MKKIALVSFSNNYDMQEYLYTLYEDMKELENEVITLGSSKVITNTDICKENILINSPDRPGIEIKTFNIRELIKVLGILRKVDVIYFISSHVWNLIIIRLLKNKVKIIHTVHDPFPHENEKSTKNIEKYNRFICNQIFNIVLHNKEYKDKFKNYYNYKGNLYCVPLWRKWKNYDNKDRWEKNILFFGRVNPYKGIHLVEKFAEELKDYNFYIVGKFSEESKVYKEILMKYENVIIKDDYIEVKEMEEVFTNADLVILPYISATQSGVVVEAYRHSRTVVAFDVGALAEQIENGISGYLVERMNTEDFTDKIKKYFNLSEKEKKKLSKRAWEYGKEIFSTDTIIKVIGEILRL
ncbi:D-inositol 3-phosphate glycosyltransferase [Clostridium tepidiprofundi DSM 19306]|uniref:D-inositol 3-phosphate glycosyltransferase n=1 Tax=Clostridium tepidiprofundi DSM 19306 TaxID=1121338 RepID=A0A151AUA3_9CLOT|nr:glycosyltransferase family 4 protein [Clostridium tepidiprofundi]KYH31218.1 D-inositol 3-phosphate glycosyltransferase [Clostridium tepidiprofundi DSM 19306]